MKKLLDKLYKQAERDNINNIIKLHKKYATGNIENFLDNGCWDGKNTFAYNVKAENIYGTDVVMFQNIDSRIKFKIWDSNNSILDFPDNYFDLITSNQVIEHLSDIDNYFENISRVLKKNGIFIVSSNNLSSWHNIFALSAGFMPFDLQSFSRKTASSGNPLGIHNNEPVDPVMCHKTIYTAKGIGALGENYGLYYLENLTAGYYPFNVLANIDKTHSAFFAIAFKK
jgi:SAM-dependent methyltransferase